MGDDKGYGLNSDISGNVYLTGESTSISGIGTNGTYQTSCGGGQDAFIAKFDNSGSLLWATYFGGSGDEYGAAISIDPTGNIFITGNTTSSNGIATSGSFQSTFGGNYDAFVAKFNSSGNLTFATYFGGSDVDQGSSISTDQSGNVYIAGITSSKTGISTSGAYQTSFGGGTLDGFLAKFNNSGSMGWATYFGGSGDDDGYAVVSDANGNSYLVGNTSSSSGIATSGAYQTSFGGGGGDAFIAKFNTLGTITWATYYGGSGNEYGLGASLNISGNVCVTGWTNGADGIATSGAYHTAIAQVGATDVFLAVFNSSGGIAWATYYGGPDNDYGYAVVSDVSGNIYVTGNTASLTGIATHDAYHDTIGGKGNSGQFDAFIAKFNNVGNLEWGSYFGDYYNDGGTALCADAKGNVFMSGYTANPDGIATTGSYQDSFGGGLNDAYLIKFDGNASGIRNDILTGNSKLNIYPNPFNSNVILSLKLSEPCHIKISILNLEGKVIYSSTDKIYNAGNSEIEINNIGDNLPPGNYIVNLIVNDQIINKKIIEIK